MTDFTREALRFFFFKSSSCAVQNTWRDHAVEEKACSGFEEKETPEK